MNSNIEARLPEGCGGKLFTALEILLLLVIVLTVVIPCSPATQTFQLNSRDFGVFLYVGWRVLNGAVPYCKFGIINPLSSIT